MNNLPRLIIITSLILLSSACSDNNEQTTVSSGNPTADGVLISGKAAKGPIKGATINIFSMDAAGNKTGPDLAPSTITDNNGFWSVNIVPAPMQILLVESVSGSYVDEADPEPNPANKRTIVLGASDTLEGVLFPGKTTASITLLTDAILRKSRLESTSTNIQTVLTNNRNNAISGLGFDPFSISPTDPVAPNGSASDDSIEYAMYLGGVATALNSAAIILGKPVADFSIMQAMSRDLSDGRLDGQDQSGDVTLLIDSVTRDFPDTLDLNQAILRFRNNNYSAYESTSVSDPVVVNEAALAQPGTNTFPVAGDDIAVTALDTSITINNLLNNDSDADGDALTSSIASQPDNGSVVRVNNSSFNYTPNSGFTGPDSFTYQVSDGKGGTDIATVVINVQDTTVVTNQNPVADAGADQTVDEFNSVDLSGSASDSDGTVVSYNWSLASGNGAVLNNNTISDPSFNAPEVTAGNVGVLVFQLTVTDNEGGTGVDFVTVIVNPVLSAPNADAGPDQSLPEQQPVTLDASGSSDDRSIVSYLWIQTSGSPTITLTGANTANPSFTGPDIANNTTFRFELTVTDDEGGTDIDSVDITLTSLNTGPTLVDDPSETAVEDTPTQLTTLLNNDSDPESDPFTINSIITQPANGNVTIDSGNTSVTYTPNLNFNGSDSFTYNAIDQSGGLSTNFATVTVTVSGTNDDPVAVTDSDTVIQGFPLLLSNLLANDTDPEGDSLSITGVTQPANGVSVNNGDGTVTYTPSLAFNGDDAFTYSIVDGNGGSAIGVINITVIADSDGDGIIDSDETANSTNPSEPDSDFDGFTDNHELIVGTDPNLNTEFPPTTIISTANGNNVISVNTTWNLNNAPYWLQNDVSIQSGVTLTIEPGVVVKSQNGIDVIVNSGGILNAIGNAPSPQQVIFTSDHDDTINGDTNGDGVATTAAGGDWGGIDYNAGSDGITRFSQVKNAASCISIINSSPIIDHVDLGDCTAYGIDVQTTSSTNTANLSNINLIDYNSNGTSTSFSGIRIYATSSATAVLNLNNIDMDEPGTSTNYGLYVYANGGFINGSIDNLTITNPANDGIHILNTSANTIDIALSNISVVGSPANSVEIRNTSSGTLLTSFDGTNSVTNNSNTSAAIRVENNDPDFLTTNTFTINNAGYGLNLINSDGAFNNFNLNNTAIAGIRLASDSNPTEFSNIVLTNAVTPYELVGQDLTATIISGYDFSDVSVAKSYVILNGTLLADMTLGVDPLGTGSSVWRIDDNVTVPAGITMTVTDDAIIKFDIGRLLYVDGTLTVSNVGGGPAIFTSIRDDSVGDDLGDPTNPARGDWNRIDFRANSTANIDNALIRYAQYGIYNNNDSPASFSVSNSSVTEFLYYGIYLYPNGAATYSLTNNSITNGTNYEGLYIFATTGDSVTLAIDGLTIDSVGANTNYRGMLLDINGNASLTGSISNVTISNTSGTGIYLDDASTGTVDPLFDTINVNTSVGTHGFQMIGDSTTIPTLTNIDIDTGIYNLTLQGVGGTYSNMILAGASTASIYVSTLANPTSWDSATIVLNSSPSPYRLITPLPASIGTLATGNTNDLGFAASSTVALNYVEVSASITDMTLMQDPLSTSSSVWRVPANLTVPSGVTLTVTDDAVVKFDSNIILYVDGTLSVPDGAGGPAIFTSIRDDSVGDDLGDPTPAARGDWNRIEFRTSSIINIDNAIIRYAIYGLYSNNANPISFNVADTTITEFLYYGMRLYPNGATTYNLTNNTITNGTNYEGLYVFGTTGDAITLAIDGLVIDSVGVNTNYRGILFDLQGDATMGGTVNNVTIGSTSGSGIYLDDSSTGIVNPAFSAITINGPVGVHGMQLVGDSTTRPTLDNININDGIYNLTLQGVAGNYGIMNLDGASTASVYFSDQAAPASWGTVTLSNSPSPYQLIAMGIPTGVSYTPGTGLNESYVRINGTLTSDLTLGPDPLNTSTGTGQATDPTVSYWYAPTHLLVGNGTTLSINASTLMKFAETTYLQVESGGVLNIDGTAGNEVYLTSFSDDAVGDSATSAAVANDWYGIYFRTGSDGGTLNYVQSWYAYYGVYFDNINTDPTFSDLTISYPLYGLYFASAGASAPSFNNINISDATNQGILFSGSAPLINPTFSGTRSIFSSSNSGDCIYNVSPSPNILISGWTLDGCQTGMDIRGPGTYIDNLVRNNGGTGIYINTTSALTVGNNRIVNNGTIGSTSGGGIRLQSIGATSVIENNFIRHNEAAYGGGIYSQGGIIDATIRNNLIIENHASNDAGGVYIYSSSTLQLLNNTIAGNFVNGNSDVGAGLKIFDFTNNITYTDNIIAENRDDDSIENIDDVGSTSVENFNLEDAASTNGLSGANSDSNTDPAFTQGWYLAGGSPAINTGSDLPVNLGLTGTTTQTNGTLDGLASGNSDQVDRGYHYSAGVAAVDATNSTITPGSISLGFSETTTFTITPRDGTNSVMGHGLDVQVTAANFPASIGRIIDLGEGDYLVQYTSGTVTGTDTLTITVNGVQLLTQPAIDW